MRFIGSRIRSPESRTTPFKTSNHPSPDERGDSSQVEPPSPASVPATPRLQIYNDMLPQSAQPQTPENLPEARHRSRLPGSYTAPVTRSRTANGVTHTPTTGRRGQAGRVPSPAGMDTPGFSGLYGGRENADDSTLFEEAMRDTGLSASRTD